MAAGGDLAAGGARLHRCLLKAEPTREAVLPYVMAFQALLRRERRGGGEGRRESEWGR